MQITLFLLGGFLLSIVFGFIIIPRILVISHKKKLYDMPDARKVHASPIPRLGGLSFFPVIQMSFLFCTAVYLMQVGVDSLSVESNVLYDFIFLFVGLIMLYLIGVCDDLIGVGYRYKFVVQIVSSLLLVLSGTCFSSLGGLVGIYELPVWFGILFTTVLIVYITNSINLIDGIDGLASGLSCIALVVLTVIFYSQSDFIYSLLTLCSLGILIPFWLYNVFGNANRGNKLFMGDAGSLTLGYVMSFLLIHLCIQNQGEVDNDNPYIMIAFSTVLVPLLDVVRVVIHRLRLKQNPFLPDKNHFHHKLMKAGMRPRRVMLFIIAVAVFFIVLNVVLSMLHMNITFMLIIDVSLWTIMHVILNHFISVREKNGERQN